jgi:AAA15 family ATPase/GTPase
MHIEYIKIKNYKSFDNSDNNRIDFNNGLNLFIGQNNSGKTTIIEALRLLNPSLIFEEMDNCWNTNFPEIDPRIYVKESNLCKFSKKRSNYFEFEIKINDISPYYSPEYSAIISNNSDSYIKYSVRIYPFELNFQFSLLKYLETDKIIVNIDVPSFNEYHKHLFGDELSKISARKKNKNEDCTTSTEYSEYLNLRGFGINVPEIDLLKKLEYFYRSSFYSPYQHIVQQQKKEYSDIIPEFKLLYDLKTLQDKVFNYKKNKNTDHNDYYLSRKLLDEFINYSKLFLGNVKFHFVSESSDYQEERILRQAWPPDESIEKLTEEERYKKFQKYQAHFGNDFPFINEYSSIGDGIKGALNIIFHILSFKYTKDNRNFNYYSLCCIVDGFSMNMHHYLSSIVFKSIIEISKAETINNQIILTSHSNSFIDFCEDVNISINHIIKTEKSLSVIKRIFDRKALINAFKELGYKPSQLFISNGIIWVEGPSDIIYINYFIQQFTKINEYDELIRGKHYDFILYGGSNIKHHEVSSSFCNNFINLLRINPNCFIVFDRDNYETSEATSSEQNKQKIIDAINDVDKYWMTQGSYIEYYLKKKDLKIFEEKIKNKKSKVEYANKMISLHKDHDYWFNNTDLEKQIEKLVINIISWNT